MKRINFSDVGVVVNSMEELDDIYLTYSTLGISFGDCFKEDCIDAQKSNLAGWFVQCTAGSIDTKLTEDGLDISIINCSIKYSMESLDFAIACQLIMSNQEDELKAHLDKYCKDFKE